MADVRSIPALRLVAVALLAGILAGAVAVYVSGALSGNGDAPQAASVEDSACAAKDAVAEALAAKAVGDVAAMQAADPPRSLRHLAFNAPDGSPMTLADRAGKAVLLNLWATWCAPCREEMPALNTLQEQEGGDGFEVIAVNVDTGGDEKPKAFLAETGVSALGYYRENTLALFESLKAEGLAFGLPVTLLIDSEGCLLANMNGPADWASPDAKALVAAAKAL